MRVVLTGFGPFPGVPFNPSAVLVKALARRRRPALAGVALTPHIFTTSYAAVDRDLPKLLAPKPDVVLMFGVAARRQHLCIETRARNAHSVLHPDATGLGTGLGAQPAVVAGNKPNALRGFAPFAELLGAMRTSRFPARLSRDAGRYVCNYAYWRALERAGGRVPLVQFVHIPPIRLAASRRRGGRDRLALPRLLAAAEMLLIALIAASRR